MNFVNDVKKYFTTNAFGLVKSRFGCNDCNYQDEEMKEAIAMSNLFIAVLILTGIIIGFFAVPNLCPDTSDRGKNVRLGLYILLILTGGQLGWFFALLWLFKINICI
jgi:hypothetical protein